MHGILDIADDEVISDPIEDFLFEDGAAPQKAMGIGFDDEEVEMSAEEADAEQIEAVELDDAVSQLNDLINDATDFMESELFPTWERAEAFYDGKSDIKKEAGRSQVTSTEVRDAIRKLKPSAMRILMQSTAIVEFEPFSAQQFVASGVAQQQTLFVNQLFWRSGGYRALLDAVHNTFTKKVGVLKACAYECTKSSYYNFTDLDETQFQQLQGNEDYTILSFEDEELVPAGVDETGQPTPPLMMYKAEVEKSGKYMKYGVEHVSLYNFFVNDSATCPADAEVIGQRDNVTVSEARELGLRYDNWGSLDSYSVEDYDAAGESRIRRGYTKDVDDNRYNVDPSMHKFLLTECYARFDLEGTGIAQVYRFWLGGTDYVYIDHERVEENPYGVVQCDPLPDAFFGRSIFDITMEDQNTLTSLLRATCDNAHLSNNRRLAVHETLVNMKDVVNPKLGSPIRVRAPGMVQEIGVSSSAASMLPLMDSVRALSNNKVGVTDASVGLDPDALQSTDKDAVLNTIQMGQGQVELMVRNIVETGVADLCVKLLKLTIRHGERDQYMELNGDYTPVDTIMFDPELFIKTNVGLGTGNATQKMQTLAQVQAKQEQIISQYGPGNPIAPIDKMFNSMEDMVKLGGLTNISRYFNPVDEQITIQLQQMYEQQQQAAQQEPPSAALIKAEEVRATAAIEKEKITSQTQEKAHVQETALKTTEMLMLDDFKRDKMAQDLAIADAKINETAVNTEYVHAAQDRDRDHNRELDIAKQTLVERQQAMAEAQRMVEFMERQQQAPQQAQQQMQQTPQQAQQAPQQLPPQGIPQ